MSLAQSLKTIGDDNDSRIYPQHRHNSGFNNYIRLVCLEIKGHLEGPIKYIIADQGYCEFHPQNDWYLEVMHDLCFEGINIEYSFRFSNDGEKEDYLILRWK